MDSRMLAFAVVVLSACGGRDDGGVFNGYVGPADRQTAVPPNLPLWVYFGEEPFPPGYPSEPDFWVFDITVDAEVPGTTWVDHDGLRFVPEEPWAVNRRYLWMLGNPFSTSHGPELAASPAIGEMQFSTRTRPEILAFGLDDAGNGCAVFSQPSGTVEVSGVWVDGAEYQVVDVFHLDPALWYDPFSLQADDPGLDVVCVITDQPIPGSGQVLVAFDTDRTWTGAIGDSPSAIVEDLRRHGR